MLSDKELCRFSVNPKIQRTGENGSKFELFSDRHVRLYSQYVLDERLRLRPGPQTPVVNFRRIKDILLSQDLSREAELDSVVRFLDGENMQGNQVAFQSWPRSGNSMLRCYIEHVSGIITGADREIGMDMPLQILGLVGAETTVDSNLVWINKTHYPIQPFHFGSFHSQKMFKIVRNPMDVLLSYANVVATFTHSTIPLEKFDKDLPEFWTQWVKLMGSAMAEDFNLMIGSETSVSTKIPSYFVRYEDLKLNPVPVVKDLFRFLLDAPSIEGTVLEKRINEKCNGQNGPKSLYKLKHTPTGLNPNAHMYNEE